MIEFRALGSVDLTGADGRTLDAVLAQPKRVALLAYLAIGTPPQFRRRDTIVGYLWPELDADHARAALRQGIHFLRQSLGPNVLTSRGDEELGLDREHLWCDATAFDRACIDAQPSRALKLYRGDLLAGLFVAGAASDFEHWLDSERERLRRQASAAAWMAVEQAAAAGQHAAAAQFAWRAAALAPDDEGALRRLIRMMNELGDRSGAVRAYEDFARRLARDYEAEPSVETKALIEAVRSRAQLPREAPFSGSSPQAIQPNRLSGDVPSLQDARPSAPDSLDATAAAFGTAPETVEGSAITVNVDRPAAARRRFPTGVALLGLGVLVGLGALFAWRRHAGAAPAVAVAPVGLAVLPFDTEGDTANGYLTNGITDEIRAKLAQLPALRLIASASSNQYRHTQKPAEQIGRELGVRYLLTGRVEWEQGANGTRRVRVSPELVELRDGAAPETKWQQSYDATLADVFDLQAAVATQVADNLGVVLSRPAQAQIAARPTQNLAAYDAYLRSTALGGDDPLTVRRALATAEEAVALDSSFAAAWARVSTRRAELYFNSTPTRADAEASHRAAERAVALAPMAPEGYIARGFYNSYVATDLAAARGAFETALRLAPSSSEANRGVARAEAAVGQWEAALGHARQAVALDPRSVDAAQRLSVMLLSLRRYPEARAEAERGLTFAPANLGLPERRAMSQLGEGNLTGARAALRDIPPTLDRTALPAFVASSWGLFWALDSADRALVLTLPPSAFDDDRGIWGIVHAELYWVADDTTHAHCYADSARLALEAHLQTTPDDNVLHLFRGLSLAYLGQRAAAVREGERGLALAEATGDGYNNIPYARHVLAQLYVAAGDHAHALDQLESLLAKPYFISPAWLKIDPTWAPLRGDPRFERLIAQPTTAHPTH